MIYFIQNEVTRNIKIGTSSNPEKRLQSLQTASAENLVILGIIDGGVQEEKKLHIMFAQHRLRGEWFLENDELVDYIKEDNIEFIPNISSHPEYGVVEYYRQICISGQWYTYDRENDRLVRSNKIEHEVSIYA